MRQRSDASKCTKQETLVALILLGTTLVDHGIGVVGFAMRGATQRLITPPSFSIKPSQKKGFTGRYKNARLFELSSSTVPLEYPADEGLSSPELVGAELNKISGMHHDSYEGPNNESNLHRPSNIPGIWPCFDELDRRLIGVSLPVIANFAINPLIGAVDLFWVNRMGNALAVAGQAAANQVFNSAFWLVSFLPSGEFSHTNLSLFRN
jgi:hypothetical protein